jgi:hypothetical protein
MKPIRMINKKIDRFRVPYLIADFIGASASAGLFGVLHMASHVSSSCSSNPLRLNYDLAFLILSFLAYTLILVTVWSIHRELPYELLSGRLNWIFIGFVGLFASSTIWAVIDSYQCLLPLSASLQKSYLGVARTSFIFLPMFLVPFLLALFSEFVIRDFTNRRTLR